MRPGLVERPLTLSIADLKALPSKTLRVTMECAGNGRAAFNPPASGNQWTLGGVGCANYIFQSNKTIYF